MGDVYDERRNECDGILRRLLAAPRLPLNSRSIPAAHGLYAIAKKGAPDGEFLHVGISTRGAGLRDRICNQHRTQNGVATSLRQKQVPQISGHLLVFEHKEQTATAVLLDRASGLLLDRWAVVERALLVHIAEYRQIFGRRAIRGNGG